MITAQWEMARRSYITCLERLDVRGGARLIGGLAGAGESLAAIIERVLRPAQVEVGRRWQANDWTVADEHAASAVTEAALLQVVSAREGQVPRGPGAVVLVCAPGEWHTLPLRMVTEVLTEAGLDCRYLGASVPSRHLRAYLERNRPLAVALSSTSPLSLDGAAESIAAAHSLGIRVLVGGHGFGPDDHRARVAGADAWTDDPLVAADLLGSWSSSDEVHLAEPSIADTVALSAEERSGVGREVISALRAKVPGTANYGDEQWARTAEDVDDTVRYAILAVRFRDDRIFTDFTVWAGDVLAARQIPPAVYRSSLEVIGEALQSWPQAAALVHEASRRPVLSGNFGTAAHDR